MAKTIREKLMHGFLNLSLRQVAGSLISIVCSVMLARLLGLEIYGLYAVSSFFIIFMGNFINWGVNIFLIRKQSEPDNDCIRTGFTMVLINGSVLFVLMFYCIAPLLSSWYGREELFWLLSLSYAGVFISSVFKISQSLLEREMDYGKVGIVEVSGIAAFYLSSVTAAFFGLGIYSIVIGEICRGLSSISGYIFRPFSMRPLLNKNLLKEMYKFGGGYVAALLPWSINGALNPVVVARLAGVEAAGIIRIAEGIVSQLSFFTGITNRMSYPVFAKYQKEKEKILNAVEKGRIYQFFLACVPLFVFSAVSFWLIPLFYGEEWYQVSNALVLMCLIYGINTVFGLYSSSLITAGRNSDVAKFTVVNGLLLWLISPITVHYFGYLGLPIAGLIASPSYYVMHRYFVNSFGKPDYYDISTLLIVTYVITIIAWSIKDIYLSPIAFILLSALFFICSKNLKLHVSEMFSLIKKRTHKLQSV